MQFDVAGNVSGAAISTYLLERSRVVSINNPERSYHIFYQLCAGSDIEEKKALGLVVHHLFCLFLALTASYAIETWT